MAFPVFRQLDSMDCGPTCLRMLAKHYGRDVSIRTLREASRIGREGVSLLGISEAAERIGFRTTGLKISFRQLDEEASLPCILHWQQNHFVVLPPQNHNRLKRNAKVLIADPAQGLVRIERDVFLKAWLGGGHEGVAMLLEPTQAFYEREEEVESAASSWSTLLFYLGQHRRFFLQVVAGMLAGGLLQLVFPFLTQGIVDTGINTRNPEFIYIILTAQCMLFFARTAIELIRSRLLLFISTRINISLLTGFWYKLMKMPMSFFDTRLVGDIQQRIQDQHEIERFLTGSSLYILFSIFSILIFSVVLIVYSIPVFAIFATGSLLYFLWVRMFLNRRRDLNYRQFSIAGRENSATIQLIQGMQEIKLNNSERYFRWDWESIQAQLFHLNFRSLSLSQYQQAGALFLNEGKNILITFFVANLVLNGQLSLGAMLAIQYIIGQLNSPVEQLVGFSRSLQDAKIALERLNEIQQIPEEEPLDRVFNRELPPGRSIRLERLEFSYPGAGSESVLKNLSLEIPARKVTAIVGISGSGKTTLLKLLLRFYDTYSGNIVLGQEGDSSTSGFSKVDYRDSLDAMPGSDFRNLSPSFWRSRCGSVMQDGYIFNATIAKNIAVGDDNPDDRALGYACRLANIFPFIESLPLGLQTNIGRDGKGISQGQRQRILIARAVYRNPEYLFFDEATNSLDASNEKMIMENLNRFFSGRTVVVVAHRLSTVRNADKIVVLHKGEVVEEGTHHDLAGKKGYYYDLVKNQLELGD